MKPSNVLLRELGGQDHAYLADFGLTKPTSSMTGLTGTGQIVGTVDYLAPEVIEGRPAGPRADQYVLGCVLYECLIRTAAVCPRDRGGHAVGAHA